MGMLLSMLRANQINANLSKSNIKLPLIKSGQLNWCGRFLRIRQTSSTLGFETNLYLINSAL